MAEHLKLTREELYSLVWAKPMTEVAEDFQISDRAMAKICARKQVPVPPRGYVPREPTAISSGKKEVLGQSFVWFVPSPCLSGFAMHSTARFPL